jgi:hypothetical protein
MSLADTQLRIRNAIVAGDAAAVDALLRGGGAPRSRLAVHRRHYQTSLVSALLGRFPATAWLVGTPRLEEAARAFVRHRPPHAPCIAEYGAEFPAFVSARSGTEDLPYLRAFMELEWHVGVVSIAIDHRAIGVEALAGVCSADLPDVTLALQPGLHYLEAAWPVDGLMRLYLADVSPPESFPFDPADCRIQIRGARGAFRIDRLDLGEFLFRRAVSDGRTIGEAAGQALDAAGSFDPALALGRLIADGLATGAGVRRRGDRT